MNWFRGGDMLSGWFLWFILIWVVILFSLFAIGGFFMFRKFLKRMPKEDGKSIMDWEDFYVDASLKLWTPMQKEFLEELVSPVPELFRDVARHKIAGKIGEIALSDRAYQITNDHVIRGYIQATPKRDHKFLRKKLSQMNIDVTPYEHLF
jgi:hypothetical protein